MIIAQAPAQTPSRLLAAAQAEALAMLIGGGVAEARVTALEPGGLARLLMDGVPLALTLPDGAAVAIGDRLAIRQAIGPTGETSVELRRLAPGETASTVTFRAMGEIAKEPALPTQARAVTTITAPQPDVEIDGPADVRSALLPAVRDALARQTGLPALFAHLRASSSAGVAWPPSMRAALSQILARQIDFEQPDAAVALKRAVEGSGVFLESDLATGGAGALARGDLKQALLALRALLRGVAVDPATGSAKSGELATGTVAPSPRPPLKGELAPMQVAPEAPIEHAMQPRELAGALLKELEGSLDRIRLLQFASLPDRPAAELQQQPNAPPAPRQWQVEIPLMMQPGAASLPLMIEREGASQTGGGSEGAAWRMRFALETAELGHVDVAVSLRRGKIDVRFWADDANTAALITGGQTELSERLFTASLPVETIQCQHGRRAQKQTTTVRQGQFLDFRS